MVTRRGALGIGDVLNENYEIEAFVAEGGTGEIYRAYHEASRSKVAIKVLKDVYSKDEAYVDLLRRECEALRNINDPAIVRNMELLWTEFRGGFYYLKMEYLEGPSLAELMLRQPVNPDTLIEIGRVLSSGLKAAHGEDVLHRDISPDNIILRGGRAKGATLIDFGIAKDLRPDARTVVNGGFAGKYEYASPEQLDGMVDARSDIYSLGATLLAAARGKTPELPSGIKEIYDAKNTAPDLDGVPQPLRGILARMICPRPDDRLADAASMLRAFTDPDIAADRETLKDIVDLDASVPPSYAGGAPKTSGRRRGWVRYVVGLTAVAALAALVWFKPLRDMIPINSLPLQEKYQLKADKASRTLEGFAPNEEARAALISSAASAFGEAPTAAVSLARGVPSEGWSKAVSGLMDAVSPLDDWQLDVINNAVAIRGEAPSDDVKTAVARRIRALIESNGLEIAAMRIKRRVAALNASVVVQLAEAYADCGALAVSPSSGSVAADQTIRISGDVSSDRQSDDLARELQRMADGRKLELRLAPLNDFVCRLRSIMPSSGSSPIKFAFGLNGQDGSKSDDDYKPSDWPTISMTAPEALDGYLYAFLVDNDGQTVHLLPHQYRQENRLSDIGEVIGGDRKVTLVFPKAEASVSNFALEIEPPYGSWLFGAVLTKKPLFDGKLRPRAENIDSFAPEFAGQLRLIERQNGLIAQTQRLLNVVE